MKKLLIALAAVMITAASYGQGQVVFLTGEAGAGKSTLVKEFLRRAQGSYPELVVAVGVGKAYAGIDDPYLPFREVLSLLSGDVEESYSSGAITHENAHLVAHRLPHAGDRHRPGIDPRRARAPS